VKFRGPSPGLAREAIGKKDVDELLWRLYRVNDRVIWGTYSPP
jgi:hypothetical protein